MYLTLLEGIRHEWFGCYIDGDVLPHVPLFASTGGHVRVGLEDHDYSRQGRLPNAEIVRRAAPRAAACARPAAGTEETRRLLEIEC